MNISHEFLPGELLQIAGTGRTVEFVSNEKCRWAGCPRGDDCVQVKYGPFRGQASRSTLVPLEVLDF